MRELVDAGYRVLGIDISGAMIGIARKRVPEAEFRVTSLFEADIPPCEAVTALGEVLNYLFDPEEQAASSSSTSWSPDRSRREFSEGEDWIVVLEKREDAERGTLTRRITSFWRVGEHYRRDDEVHRLRLYGSSEIAGELRRAGFRVRTMRGYGLYRLARDHAAFLARKPARDKEV